MPWSATGRPSLAAGLIKSVLHEHGLSARVLHPNLDLAREVGLVVYEKLGHHLVWPHLGDWLFARTAFEPESSLEGLRGVERWMNKVANPDLLPATLGEDWVERLTSLREKEIPKFCARVAHNCLGFKVVGFTCGFNQLVPSLAAARTLRELSPGTRILLGGPQVEGETGREIIRSCPWIDAVYDGEFETEGVSMVRWALGETPEPGGKSTSWRQDNELVLSTCSARLKDLNDSPTPDFDDFYVQAKEFLGPKGERLRLDGIPFESARGCWWGQHSQCTFCGLNGGAMRFRSKNPDAVLEQVLYLSSRHEQFALRAVDNIIDHKYMKSLLPRLAEMDLGLEFFYETKANLGRNEVKLMRDAGISTIQPGIESFSTSVLALMRKGSSGLRNVYLLKLCRQYELNPLFNILYGFPGETPGDQLCQCDWIARIHHLMPPSTASSFILQRHSPMHGSPASHGIKNMRPSSGYAHVYPPSQFDIDKVAFYFDYDVSTDQGLIKAHRKLRRAIHNWKRRWEHGREDPQLTYRNGSDLLLVRDARNAASVRQHKLRGLDRAILLAADDPVSVRRLEEHGSSEEVEGAIQRLEEVGLILLEKNTLLGLAIPHPRGKRPLFQRSIADASMNSQTC